MIARVALATMDPYPWVVDDEVHLRDALARRGVEVVSPAWTADFPWSTVDLVLLRTTWDYHLRHHDFLAWCERVAAVTRLVHGPRVVRWNVDKRYLAALAERGAPMAPTIWLPDGAPLPGSLPARGFLKPIIGANAHATLKYSGRDVGAIEAHRAAFLGLGGFMLQPYLAAVETEGELSAICVAGRYAHGVRKVPAAGDYRVQEDWGARDEAYDFLPAERALIERVVAAAGSLVGERLVYGRVDLLRDDAGALVVNEVELVEPCLFFRHGPRTADLLVDALLA
ncbi:MAG: hypothetical protein IT385_22115 [Deltaproteobacteria bacterium]|nr:hypothetical protein [Deltaproteobacteria bacterium]